MLREQEAGGRGVTDLWFLSMRTRTIIFPCLLALCCRAFGDSAYPPVVGNLTSAPVKIMLQWTEGPDQPGYLPPKTKCFQRLKGRSLMAIQVKTSDGGTRRYGQEFLERLRLLNGSSFEVWVITETGLTLQRREGLRQFE